MPYPPAPTADPALHPWLHKQALKYLSHSPAAVLALTPVSQGAAVPQVGAALLSCLGPDLD